jgi:hypothetical protein
LFGEGDSFYGTAPSFQICFRVVRIDLCSSCAVFIKEFHIIKFNEPAAYKKLYILAVSSIVWIEEKKNFAQTFFLTTSQLKKGTCVVFICIDIKREISEFGNTSIL